jgi:hypothetical protein
VRTLNHKIGTPPFAIVSEPVDTIRDLRRAVSKARRWLRRALCQVVNGGHELYRARTDTRIFQQCLLCGYETPGWTIDRLDRRLHLIANGRPRKAS